MSNEEINKLFYSLQKEIVSRVTQREPKLEDIVARRAPTSTSQQAYFEGANYFNSNDFSYGNPIMRSQESSSSYYQEQFRQPSDEELFLALNEKIKKDKDALEIQWPNMETKMDANMIANNGISCININKEMCSIMDRIAIQAEELEKVLKEQSSRKLPSDIKNDDIRECENVTLSLEDELLSPTLECDIVPLILEVEFQVSSLVENNALSSEEEPVLKEMQIEKKHPDLLVENVLVGVEDFNFPIEP